jgi:hypothetical protein
MSVNPRYDQLLSAIRALHDRKHQDYAQPENPYSNFEFAALVSQGFTDPMDRVFATLCAVKMARLQELTRPDAGPPNHESVQDTRRDLANYACLWASYSETVL